MPQARVAVFVGNAWDPKEGRETPWMDIARQLAGEKGAAALGKAAWNTPPGTEAIGRVFQAAEGPVLLLFDEVLNFLNRHRGMAEQFHAFIQNLTVATTGTTHGAAVISLPRSQVEMTDWDLKWQEKITRVVRRVAKDLIANDETEISEVVRRRLFEDIGNERVRNKVAKTYADWCFERRAELPPEWTAVDTAATEAKAREQLRNRFETCYPFHPSTLSVFQRKWQTLPQYQQTRGTLAMLAQWISWAYQTGYAEARREPLLTLGSAPLEAPGFRGVVLGQLGESRLIAALDADISGTHSHARALDADTRGSLRNIHRRVGATIMFESFGGQVDKVAHLPELRFALGEPEVDTTSVDNAAFAMEDKSYFIRRVGSDGFKISHQPTVKKVVNDRRASLDEESEIKPAMRRLVEEAFRHGASVPLVVFPEDGSAVQDTPKLTLALIDPEQEWTGGTTLRQQIGQWTKFRGQSPRLYPGALVWCWKKPGRDLRDSVEMWLAWKRVAREIADGTLGGDFDRASQAEIQAKAAEVAEAAKNEVWAGYRFAVLYDPTPHPSPTGRGSEGEGDGLETIDLGAGHSSSGETLCGRVIAALKSRALLNESVGAGYLERNWPPALKQAGAWPLAGLRQSFLNGSLTRLLDPDTVLRGKIVEFVERGDFGIVSGQKPEGGYERLWFKELIASEEVTFEPGVFLLLKSKAEALKSAPEPEGVVGPEPIPGPVWEPEPIPDQEPGPEPVPGAATRTLRIAGDLPPEVWNRLGIKLVSKLRSGSDLMLNIEFLVTVEGAVSRSFEADLKQILDDLGLADRVRVELAGGMNA
ncbi:MAG TPA: DUF499 domain-containing protein [Atribacteraceae bacterium]|nr:DUF499 domain-containing protein [Atribacteraceae bacterium]